MAGQAPRSPERRPHRVVRRIGTPLGISIVPLLGLRNREALDAEIQFKLNELCQDLMGNFVSEIPIAEELNDNARLSAVRPDAAEKSFVRRQAIDEFRDLPGEPLIFDSVPHAMSPARVSMASRQEGSLWRPPGVTGAMGKVRLSSKRGGDLRRVQDWMHDEQVYVEPSQRRFRRVLHVSFHLLSPGFRLLRAVQQAMLAGSGSREKRGFLAGYTCHAAVRAYRNRWLTLF